MVINVSHYRKFINYYIHILYRNILHSNCPQTTRKPIFHRIISVQKIFIKLTVRTKGIYMFLI